MRVKVEINTYETSPARPRRRVPYRVDSSWWSGPAEVLTFQTEELVATKLRAMFQRKKGRDLFDLWLALTVLSLDPAEIVACLDPYRPEGYTSERAIEGLGEHLADPRFGADLAALVGDTPAGYDIDSPGAGGCARLADGPQGFGRRGTWIPEPQNLAERQPELG